MTFLLPAWLLLGSLVLVVLAFHLRKRRRIVVPSLLIWHRIEDEAAAPRRVKVPPPTWLLLLQLLIVIVAALALAQPILGGGTTPRHTIYILDNSVSMAATDVAPTRFDAARAFLAETIAATGEDERISVVTLSPGATILAARQDDPAGVMPLLDGISATDAHADWPSLAGWLEAILRDGEDSRVVVLSDAADPGLIGGADGYALSWRVFATEEIANRTLTADAAPADAEGAWRVTGRLAGAAEETVLAIGFLPRDGEAVLDLGTIAAPPGDFSVDVELPGAGILVLSAPPDAAPQDDVVRIPVDPAPVPPAVLHVGAANPVLADALAANGVDVVEAAALPEDDARYALVVVDGVAVPRPPRTNTLWLGAAQVAGGPLPAAVEGLEPTSWRADHPLSADLDWPSLAIDGPVFASPPVGGAVPILGSGETSLIAEWLTGAGRQTRVAFAVEDADWGETAFLPVFIRNLLARTGEGPDSVCLAGSLCPLPARLAGSAGVELTTGVAATVAADGGWTPLRAGLYRFLEDGAARTVAVNAAADPAVPAFLAADLLPAPQKTVALSTWLLGLLLVLVIAEAILSGRADGGFLRADALSPSDPRHGRNRLVLAIEAAVAILVVLALVGVPYPTRQSQQDVVLVTTDGAAPPELALPSGARVGSVAFLPGVAVTADLASGAAAASPGEGGAGGLGEAMRLAAAMVPAGREGDIVIATDGNADALRDVAAIDLGRSGIRMHLIEEAAPAADILVADVSAPRSVHAGEPFLLSSSLFSTTAREAVATILRDGEPIGEQPVTLAPGSTRLDILMPAAPEGPTTYEVALAATGDPVAENDRFAVAVEPEPPARIAVLTPDLSWGQYLADAIAMQGLEAEILLPQQAPRTLEGWLRFDLVVTMNLPALALDTAQQELLETAVSAHARGLLILGGENAFGPGGYYETAFERLSPVSSRVPRDAPQAAIVFVLDRSGSMQAGVGGGNRLDVAKIATTNAIELLEDNVEVGVIAFDSATQVIVPLGPKTAAQAATEAIQRVQAGGGTALFPALTEALRMLERSEAAVRHIVVLTDGLSEAGDFFPLLQRARSQQITISTIGTGEGADVALLRQIANIGGGAFSATRDFAALPSILSREALLLGGSPLRSRSAAPQWQDRDAAFLADAPEILPQVRSYVVTTPKPTADIHATIDDLDGTPVPLLASWTYGSGRVVAFTSHGAGPGTRDWLEQAEFPRFWSQAIRHALPAAQAAGLHVATARSGADLVVTVDYLDAEEAPVAGAELTVTLSVETGEELPGPVLEEREPGRYVGALPVPAGTYTVTVTAPDATAERRFVMPYAAALDTSRTDFEPLRRLVAATGGSSGPDLRSIASAPSQWRPQSGWWIWTLAALLTFLGALAIRHRGRFRRRRNRAFGLL